MALHFPPYSLKSTPHTRGVKPGALSNSNSRTDVLIRERERLGGRKSETKRQQEEWERKEMSDERWVVCVMQHKQ